MVADVLPADPLPINENLKCSNMVADIAAGPPYPPWPWEKGQ